MAVSKDVEIVSFESQKDFEKWLSKNFDKFAGIWIRFYKKNSGVRSVTYSEALDEALCYGWIDGQLKKYDEHSYIQRFTPRRPKSIWSKRNREHVARLIDLGKMKPSGMKQVEAAKSDGRWDQAYDSPAAMQIPEDLSRALSKNKKATAFFDSLNKANKYAIVWRLQTAKKSETRVKRLDQIMEMLKTGKKFHP